MGRKPDKTQQRIDFERDRREQFAHVAQLLGSDTLLAALGGSAARRLKVSLLLERINSRRGTQDVYQVPVASLAHMLGQSCRQTRRTIADAQAAGVLTVRGDLGRGGQGWNFYAIEWPAVRLYAMGDTPREPGGQDGRALCHDGRALGQDGRALCHSGSAYKDSYQVINQDKTTRAPTARPAADPWRVVVDFLRLGCELVVAARVVTAARGNGLTAAEVEAIGRHYLESRPADGPAPWSAGALAWRIEHGLPGQPAADGWPDPAEAYVRHRRREAAEQAARRAQAARVAEYRKAAEQADSDDQGRHLAALESMGGDELQALADEHLPPMLRLPWRRQGLGSALCREFLVSVVKQQTVIAR